MTSRIALADAVKPRVFLADVPKRGVDPNRIAATLGVSETVPAPPCGPSPLRWYAVRKVAGPRSFPPNRE